MLCDTWVFVGFALEKAEGIETTGESQQRLWGRLCAVRKKALRSWLELQNVQRKERLCSGIDCLISMKIACCFRSWLWEWLEDLRSFLCCTGFSPWLSSHMDAVLWHGKRLTLVSGVVELFLVICTFLVTVLFMLRWTSERVTSWALEKNVSKQNEIQRDKKVCDLVVVCMLAMKGCCCRTFLFAFQWGRSSCARARLPCKKLHESLLLNVFPDDCFWGRWLQEADRMWETTSVNPARWCASETETWSLLMRACPWWECFA
jgi:hypothetical protein